MVWPGAPEKGQHCAPAFGVSAGVGVVFGIYPAMKAWQINPIEAAPYE